MRGEQINRIPGEEARAQSPEKKRDPAEVLFDEIMKDVRARQKKGEVITFGTHRDYFKWKDLRDGNIESTPITPAQHAMAKEKAQARLAAQEAEEAEMEDLSIDKFYKDGKRIDSSERASGEQAKSLLSGKKESALNVSGRLVEGGFEGKEAERQIRSIVNDMEQLKNVYSIQINSLEGMGLMDKILGRRAALEKQMAETQADILLKSQALIKEFKVSGKEFADQDAIVEKLWDLSKKFDNKISLGEAAVALVVLTSVIAGCGGEFVKKVSAADNFKAPAMAFQDSDNDSGDETRVSSMAVSETAGFRSNQEAVSASADSTEVVAEREVYKLNADEASKVKGFSGWRKMILNPEFIGKLQKDGTIPTTKKGLNTAIGTKVLVKMGDKILSEMVVEKGSSIWKVLEENKDQIKDSAEENGGFEKVSLEVISPKLEDKAEKGLAAKSGVKGGKVGKRQANSGVERTQPTAEESISPELKAELDHANNVEVSAKLSERGVKHSLGSDYYDSAGYDSAIDELTTLQKSEKDLNIKNTVTKEIKRLKDSKDNFLKKSGLEKDAAKKILAERGASHVVGKDYGTIDEYDKAIEELKNIGSSLGEGMGVIVDMKESDAQRDLAKAKRGVDAEVARLEEAQKSLRIKEHQDIIDKEAKIPQPAAPEKVEFAESVSWEQMAREDEIKLRADKYTDVMLTAYNIISRVDLALSRDVDEEKMKTFYVDAVNAKKIYSDLLKPGIIEDDFAAKKFVVKQCEMGLKIAEKNIKIADNALPKESVNNIIDSVKSKLDTLLERNKNRSGNVALFGADGVLEMMQLVVENTLSTGKISNADMKQLRKVKKTVHSILGSKNNLPNDFSTAKDVLQIINDLNQAVSKKNQSQSAVDLENVAPGVRYETPNLTEHSSAKNLEKLLSSKVKDQINQAYELAGKLHDNSPSSEVASDLVSAASLLEQLLLRPMEVVDIQDKLDRAEDLILETQAKVLNSKIYPVEYGQALEQLNSAFVGTKDSLVKGSIIDKQAAPAARSGKRVAGGK